MRTLLAALAFLLFAAAPAHGAFAGAAADPAGDAPTPAQDLVGLSVDYDADTGRLAAQVHFAGDPEDAASFVSVIVGRRSGEQCMPPAASFSWYTESDRTTWLRFDNTDGAPLRRGDAGRYGFLIQKIEATDKDLRGGRWDCAMAVLSPDGDPQTVLDQVGPIAVTGVPELEVDVRSAGKRLKLGRRARLRIVLRNTGDGPVRDVRIRFGKARGVRIAPRRRAIGTLAPGRRVVAKLGLTVTRRAKPVSEVDMELTAQELTGTGTLTLRRPEPKRKPPKGDKPSGGGGGGGAGGQVCTQYFPDLSGETGGSLGLVPC